MKQSKESLVEDALARVLRGAYADAATWDDLEGGSENVERIAADELVLRAEIFGDAKGGTGR